MDRAAAAPPRAAAPQLKPWGVGTAGPPQGVERLGERTALGAIWSVLQIVGSKVVSSIGQVALAWLLRPSDFGVVGLAYTIAAFALIVQQIGVNEILVQRGRHFYRWANAAFWMSLAAGLVAGLIMVAAAPLAARMYHAPGLVGVIAVLALSCPINALSVVPVARLQHDLRFGAFAWLGFWTAAAQVLLSVLLAAEGLGAYSFVWPRVVIGTVQAILLWRDRPVSLRLDPQFRRWRLLFADSRYILVSWLFFALIAQGDYMSLGVWNPVLVVGIYYFGFNLSIQLNTVFAQSIWRVLLPALSRMRQNRTHQLSSYLRAVRMMAVVSTPFCLMLATLADPGIRLFFAPRWYGAIPVVQALSVGMTLSVVGTTGHILLQAQGKFRALMYLSMGLAMLFVAVVIPAAALGSRARMGAATCVALVVGGHNLLSGPINLYGGIRSLGGRWRDVWHVFASPLSAGALAVGCAYVAARGLAHSQGRIALLMVILATSAVGLGLYAALIGLLAPAATRELVQRLAELVKGGRSRAETFTSEEAA